MAFPGYDGLWLPPEQDPRPSTAALRGEKACLLGYLDHYRATLRLKCTGLTAAQLGKKAIPPSNLSLLGLVRHLARVEHSWARRVIEAHTELARHFDDAEDGIDLDAGFNWSGEASDSLVSDAFTLWHHEIIHAQDLLERTDFDRLVLRGDEQIEVRDIVVHLIEEYARHCGHADLIRECIDGRAGL